MSSNTNDSIPVLIRTAQVVGVTSAAWLSGGIGWISYGLIPTIKMAPVPLLVKQWKNQYEIGASTAPFVALISGVSFSYLMTQHGKHIGMLSEKSFYLTAAAGVLIPAIVPFTILVIKPVNDKLAAIVEALDGKQPGEVAVEEQKVEPLLKQWNRLNATRSVMVGLGAVAGLLAIVW